MVRVTAEARSAKWNRERRRRLRARYSTRVLANIGRMLVEHLSGIVPPSLLGKALQYMSGQWPERVRYVGNGNWPNTNNWCKNSIGPFVVGRKGWLVSDIIAGAQTSANLFSLVEHVRRTALNRTATWSGSYQVAVRRNPRRFRMISCF